MLFLHQPSVYRTETSTATRDGLPLQQAANSTNSSAKIINSVVQREQAYQLAFPIHD